MSHTNPYQVGDVVQRRGAGGQPGIVRHVYNGIVGEYVDVEFAEGARRVSLDIVCVEPWSPSPFEVACIEGYKRSEIARNVGVNDDRRHEGNTLKHPSTRFVTDHGGTTAPHGDPLYKYGQPVVCKNTFKGVSR